MFQMFSGISKKDAYALEEEYLLPPHLSEKLTNEELSFKPDSRPSKRSKLSQRKLIIVVVIDLLLFIGLIIWSHSYLILQPKSLESRAWSSIKHHVSLLDVPPICHDEFLSRQAKLAATLKEAGIDAFVTEPSASSTYYANVSASYDLSERPFLIILDKDAKFSYLAPKFELGRIASLQMVYDEKKVIEWKEEESPFSVLKRESGFTKIMLDEHARFLISTGLQGAGIEVVPMSRAVQQLRSVKSEAELTILRGINEFTLQLVRALQRSIKIGMSQDTIRTAAQGLFERAGVGKGFWAIVLFGEQAANPHGGSLGKTLSDGEFVLIDIGSNLHEYGSDVTRTILPSKSTVSRDLWGIWHTVHGAQSAAIELMRPNETCSVVDNASREIITEKGLGEFFTHRLGHGLGLEMHEHPYLNGANGEKLKVGEVVTNEPGIYVTREQAKKLSRDTGFGVRIEDAVLVTEKGGVPLTGARAKSPYEP